MRWKYRGRGRAVWKPRFHVLAVPAPSGYLFSLAVLDKRTPCHPLTHRCRLVHEGEDGTNATSKRYAPLKSIECSRLETG